jgi:HK97 family phage major capsid protein
VGGRSQRDGTDISGANVTNRVKFPPFATLEEGIVPKSYLEQAKERITAMRAASAEVIKTAETAGRGLTEDEFRSISETAEKLKAEEGQVKLIEDEAVRAAAVGTLAANLTTEDGGQQDGSGDGTGDGGSNGSNDGNQHRAATRTNQRDPGHYRSVIAGGQHSFFGDLLQAGKYQEPAATKRLAENTAFLRAAGPVTQAAGGLGIVPPKWLTDEYLKMGRQGRVVANLVRRIPIGADPRPMVLPKQTAQVDADMTNQAAEGTNNTGWGDPLFTTNTNTLTPVAAAAYQDVSRQLLASSTPSADVLIMQDLRDAWDLKAETAVCAAIMANGTAFSTFATDYSVAPGSATATQFNFVSGTTGGGSVAVNTVVDAETTVAGALYGPADIAIMNYSRFGKFRKLNDLNGRPLMPITRYNPMNAAGAIGQSTSNMLVGDIEGVDAYGTNGVPGTSVPSSEKYAVLRSNTVLFAESDLLEFNYEQIVGPSAVRMGIFGYLGVLVRVPAAVQVFTVTAA